MSRSARVRATGSRWRRKRGASEIVRLIDAPRCERALPTPFSERRTPARVRSSNVPKYSSRLTGKRDCEAGSVSPSAKVRLLRPRVSSTYFRPRTERGRRLTVESTGISPATLSSLRIVSAPVVPSDSRTGRMSSTTPMRWPPSRTSLPGSRLAPLETWTFSWRVGTNGSPLLAL